MGDNAKSQIKNAKQANQDIAKVLSKRGKPIPETTSPKYGYLGAGARIKTLDSRGGRRNKIAVNYISNALSDTNINSSDAKLTKEKLSDGYGVNNGRYSYRAAQGGCGRD